MGTSPRVAKKASKQLRSKSETKSERSVAASDLAQKKGSKAKKGKGKLGNNASEQPLLDALSNNTARQPTGQC
jgi:hypothetical protein